MSSVSVLEFGQYSPKRVEFVKDTNQLILLFHLTDLYVLDASAIRYLIKIWPTVHFHEVIDSLTDRHYSLQLVRRHRNGIPVCGPDDFPKYTLQVIYAPESCPLFQVDYVFNENPVFYHQEWRDFCAWMSTLTIPEYETRFDHLEHSYLPWEGVITNTSFIGRR